MNLKSGHGYTRRDFLALAVKGTAFAFLSGCSTTQYMTIYQPAEACFLNTGPEPEHAAPPPGAPAPGLASGPCTPGQQFIHEVAPMETVPRLAQTYGVDEEEILEANDLKPGEPLEPGRKLFIPHPTRYRNVVPVYKSNRWKYIVVHHTAGEFGKALLVDQMHRDRGFENGLGYHFLIDNGTLGKGNGQMEVAPRWIKQECGAHCKASGMNDMGIGIGIVGNFNECMPSSAQLLTLTKLVCTLANYYTIPASRVLGHRQVPEARTDCPGKRFPWESFSVNIARLAPSSRDTASSKIK